MRKRWIILLALTVAMLVGGWLLIFRKADRYEVKQGIPRDAVFVVETPSFNHIHAQLHRNKIWSSLKEYPYFESYHTDLRLIDSLCEEHPVLRRLLTDRPFAISCHWTPPSDYDFLYVCDLGKLNVIQTLEGALSNLFAKGKITRKGPVTEVVTDSLKFYYAIKANLLFFSFSRPLLSRAWEDCGTYVSEKKAPDGDLMLDLNHHRLGQLLQSLIHAGNLTVDSSAWEKTTLTLRLKDKGLYFKGKTIPNRKQFSVWNALNLVDGGKSYVKDIIGDHVAGYCSVCYSSFGELAAILLENYKLDRLEEYNRNLRTLNRLNNYLGVDLSAIFTSWVGNEMAVIKPAVDQENRLDNLVLAIRSKDIDLAQDQLNYLTEQINRKTPVKFRKMQYNGYTINYLSLKGFFQLFLGSLFQKFDKPYYTVLGDYVVFSNSASTLATMIKDYALGNTLAKDQKYNELMEQLGNNKNVYVYISSPETYEYLYRSLTPAQRTEFIKNKGAFQSFESVGFALSNVGSAYEVDVIANHNMNASEEYEMKEKGRELEEWANRIESGYYTVVIPDSIAVSVRGEYAYQTDELSYAGKLSDGEPDGVWNITDKHGRAIAQYIYKAGKPHGEARFFAPDGVVLVQILYQEGKIASYKEFFQDGTLKTELQYNKGLKHGEARFYYSTGHLLGEGKYKKGRPAGTWKYYRVTGETERKMKY